MRLDKEPIIDDFDSPIMVRIVKSPITRSELQKIAELSFGDMVKAVVDVDRGTMAIAGELHSDEESVLLQDGSKQHHLWGINLYPSLAGEAMIEFDSMINIRPSQGNRSRGVEDEIVRTKILQIVQRLILDERI